MRRQARASGRAALLIFLGALAALPAAAQVFPAYLNYQGKLGDASGNPLTGTYSFGFYLYNQSSGGTLLFTDANYTGSNAVGVVNGVYSVQIGSLTAGGIPVSAFFNSEVWLEVHVNAGSSLSGADTLTPRERLTTSPFAFLASNAEYLGAGVAIATFTTGGNLEVPYGVTAGTFTGNGAALTSLTAANVAGGTLGATVIASSVAASGVAAGTYGSSTQVGQVVIGVDGRVTSATNVTITGAAPSGPAGGALTGSYPNPTFNLGNQNTWTAVQIFNGGASFPGSGLWSTSGNVGVGTTSPATLLDVNGSAQFGSGASKSTFTASGSLQVPNGVTAGTFTGNGAALTSLTAANVAGGTLGPTVIASSVAASGVAAGTYGSGTQVGQVVIGVDGRVTSATNIAITGAAPSGAAGGNLAGTYPNPIIGLNVILSSHIANGAITNTQVAAGTFGNITLPAANVAAGSLGASVIASSVAAGAITTTQIAAAAGITGSQIAAGTLTNSNHAVGNYSNISIPAANVTGPGALGNTVIASSVAASGVAAGTYGSGTQVGQVVIGVDGRVTSATNVAITGAAPSGVAGGNLAGTYPNPIIGLNVILSSHIANGAITTTQIAAAAGITGSQIAAGTLTNGNHAVGNYSNISIPAANVTGPGALGNTVIASSVAASGVAAGTYGSGTQVGQVVIGVDGRVTSATNVAITGAAPSGAAGGNLAGTYPNPIIGLNVILSSHIANGAITNTQVAAGTFGNITLPAANVATGSLGASVIASSVAASGVAAGTYGSGTQVGQVVIGVDGRVTSATNVAITGAAPSGAAGGNLAGTYPNPIIGLNVILSSHIANGAITTTQIAAAAGITGSQIAAGTLTNGNHAVGNYSNISIPAANVTGPGSLGNTVIASSVAASGVAAGTYGSGTQVGQVVIGVDGRVTSATNITITGAAPSGAAGGNLAGTYPNPIIGPNVILSSHIANGAITTTQIAAAAGITGSQIAAGTLTNGNHAVGNYSNISIPAANVTGPGSLGNTVIASSVAASGVAAGTYGSGTQVGQVVIGVDGRVTSATNVAITGAAPSGAAGGNLAGTYPNPIIGLNVILSSHIANGAITTTQIAAAAGITGGQIAAGTLTNSNHVVGNYSNISIPAANVTGPGTLGNTVIASSVAASGVAAGTYGSGTQVGQVVIGVDGRVTSATNVTITGAAPSGPAGGALTGSYPNPTFNLGNQNTWTAVQIFNGGASFPGSGLWSTAGNVGVGTTNPATLFDDNGSAQFGSGATKSTFTAAGVLNLASALTVANGGTGATTAAGAQTNLGVPSTTGSGASGTWSINITGTSAGAPPSGAAGGNLNGTYPNPGIASLPGISGAALTSLTGANVSGNIPGSAANVTGTVAVGNGGTGATTAAGALGNLGALPTSGGTMTGTLDVDAWEVFNLNTQTYPVSASGGGLNWNFTGGQGESDFWNLYTPAGTSFNWYQLTTSGSAGTRVMSLSPAGALTAASFSGGGASLTGLTGANVSGNIPGSAANVTGTVAVGNGGTGATTAAGAQTNLGVPSTTGSGASGTWGINITGTSAGAPPSGAAGGNLNGTYPNPGIASLPGISGAALTGLTGANVSGNIPGSAANVTGTVAVGNGGTGATTAAGAQSNLGVPSTTGSGASGTWGINITGTSAGAPPTGAAGGVLSGSYPSPSFNASGNASYPVAAANGNGVYFWNGGNTYAISMGNSTLYDYGGVTDYSIKTTMDGTAGRGFTWGVAGSAPTAALTTGGALSLSGGVTGTSLTLTGTTGAQLNSNTGTYGSLNISGSNNSYAGLRFTASPGTTNADTLMVHSNADIQGFYRQASSAWSWYFQNGVLAVGTVPAASINAGTAGISITGNAANVTGTIAVGNGGTGATTAAGAQSNLGVPSTTGSGASGTWGINITGTSAGATPTGTAGGNLNGTYPNPGIASLPAISGANLTSLTPGNISGGTAGINITGNAATASNASKLIGMNWYWSGQGGQPTWLWGGSDGTNLYVYNPSNFVVSNVTGLAGTWSGINDFQSNKGASSYVGANSSYALEATSSDGGAAGMSFLRNGYYAVNMGLDPDNVLRIGGWSAGANLWQLDMGGNQTLAGNLSFSAANPYITSGGSYIIIPNGAYFSGGIPYFQTEVHLRAGIEDDTNSNMTLYGGTSGNTAISGTTYFGTGGSYKVTSAGAATLANATAGTVTTNGGGLNYFAGPVEIATPAGTAWALEGYNSTSGSYALLGNSTIGMQAVSPAGQGNWGATATGDYAPCSRGFEITRDKRWLRRLNGTARRRAGVFASRKPESEAVE